jgi:putative FmdB family regulatory protein
MPIYEYKCSSCNLLFETIVNLKEVADTSACKSCGKPAKRKQVPSSFGFSFKGGNPSEGRADMIVGRTAMEGWEAHHKRQDKKNKIRAKAGEKFVVRNTDGSYAAAKESAKNENKALYSEHNDIANKLGSKSEKNFNKSLREKTLFKE